MTHATSSFLNKPVRSESQAQADIERAASEQARDERRRRLDDHGATFCRTILDGAFERVYQPDGGYTLREIQSGLTRAAGITRAGERPDDMPVESQIGATALPPPVQSSKSTSAYQRAADTPETLSSAVARVGYATALRDLSGWISHAAAEPTMDAATLTALKREITRLSRAMEIAPINDR